MNAGANDAIQAALEALADRIPVVCSPWWTAIPSNPSPATGTTSDRRSPRRPRGLRSASSQTTPEPIANRSVTSVIGSSSRSAALIQTKDAPQNRIARLPAAIAFQREDCGESFNA